MGEFMKRAQAAIEFLMTYGWAIMITIGALAALTLLGVFDNVILPDKCDFGTDLYCQGAIVTGGAAVILNMSIVNSLGQDIYYVWIEPIDFNGSIDVEGQCQPSESSKYQNLTANGKMYFSCGPPITINNQVISSGSRVKLHVKIHYKNSKETDAFDRVIIGEIYEKVQ